MKKDKTVASTGAKGHRERLKQSFLRAPEQLEQVNLLELLLTYAIPQKDVMPLAQALIERFGDLGGVLSANQAELEKIPGIGQHVSVLLRLVAKICNPSPEQVVKIKNSRAGTEKALKPLQPDLLPISDHTGTCVAAEPSEQATLFATPAADVRADQTEPQAAVTKTQKVSLFGKSVFKETLEILPEMPLTFSNKEQHEFLQNGLHFNSEQTRKRYASYVMKRLFPSGKIDLQIIEFAKRFGKGRFLQDLALFRFLRAEPIVSMVINDVVLPAIGSGLLRRHAISDYLFSRFPESRSISDCTQGILEVLKYSEIARVEKTNLLFSYREPCLPSFCFIVHDLYKTPGIFDLTEFENSAIIKSMLWNPERIKHCLIGLRNAGLIAKVSEIDNVRLFSLRYSFDTILPEIEKAFAS